MSSIKVNLTKEEKEEFAKLTEQEQQQFLDDALAMRHTLMVKTAVVDLVWLVDKGALKNEIIERIKRAKKDLNINLYI